MNIGKAGVMVNGSVALFCFVMAAPYAATGDWTGVAIQLALSAANFAMVPVHLNTMRMRESSQVHGQEKP